MTTAAAAVLYEDEDLLVLNKPSGLLSEGGADRESDLEQVARAHTGRATWCCHRLDRLTSGVVLLRKTNRFNVALGDLFARHRARKLYWAIVDGAWDARINKVETQLAPLADRPGVWANVTTGGKPAVSTFRVLGRTAPNGAAPARTWLGVLLKTGRTHQARLHCLHAGCPVIGDPVYGRGSDPAPSGFFGLHARELRFRHPGTGAELSLAAEPPAVWSPVLDTLRTPRPPTH